MTTKKFSSLDKNLEKLVSNQEQCLGISIRNQRVVIQGEKTLVDSIEENLEDLTIGELCRKMQKLNVNENCSFRKFHPAIFPPLTEKFKSKNWKWDIARKNLDIYFGILGFGYGNNIKDAKQYKKSSDKPEFWPDTGIVQKLCCRVRSHESECIWVNNSLYRAPKL